MKNLDSKFLRKTLGKYSTGVTIVTSIDNDGTCNSLSHRKRERSDVPTPYRMVRDCNCGNVNKRACELQA